MPCGGMQQKAPPSPNELAEYYSQKYYQQGLGSYSVNYSADEIAWWRLRAELTVMCLERLMPKQRMSLLDVGCGEGWLIDAMHQRSHIIAGFDFSKTGIERWHPHLLTHFTQGNIYELLQSAFDQQKKFDVIFLGNVIEHLLDPEAALDSIKKILSPGGLLVMVVPNDFSDTQQAIIQRNPALKPWWIHYEHISYFNTETMTNFVAAKGFQIEKTLGDYPIELDLFTSTLNYVNNKSAGPEAHRKRMLSDIFLFNKSPELLYSLYSTLGESGVGRNLTYYCRVHQGQ